MKLKSERQIRKIRTALISGIALVAVGATVAPVTHAADITTGGIECVSNNLSQAINTPIIWDGFRVRNESATADRFVLCPIMNYVDIDGGVADLIDQVFILVRLIPEQINQLAGCRLQLRLQIHVGLVESNPARCG